MTGGGRGKLFPRRVVLLLSFALAASAPQVGHGQPVSRQASASPPESLQPSPIPLSYDPSTAKKTEKAKSPDLGRAVIIALGSLPFTAFYADFAFDSVRFTASGFDLQYAPWPFKNQYSAEVSATERFIRLGVALGASAIIGILDLVIAR